MFSIQFLKATHQRLPYDYFSIMHFTHNQYAINKELNTIAPINSSIPPESLGISTFPTDTDYQHILLLYCQGRVSYI